MQSKIVSSKSTSPRVFISYRHDDEPGFVDSLYSRIANHFGSDNVFFDRVSLHSGVSINSHIQQLIPGYDLVLVIIGRNWEEIMLDRANDPDDPVRLEIEMAITLGKSIIPVMVHETERPDFSNLPGKIPQIKTPLHARIRRIPDFENDTQQLIEAIHQKLNIGKPTAKLTAQVKHDMDLFRQDRVRAIQSNTSSELTALILIAIPATFKQGNILDLSVFAASRGNPSNSDLIVLSGGKYSSDGYRLQFNFKDEEQYQRYFQIYDNGVIEFAEIIHRISGAYSDHLSLETIEETIVENLKKIKKICQELNIEFPIGIFISLTNTRRKWLRMDDNRWYIYGDTPLERLDENAIDLPIAIIDSFSTDLTLILKPILDKLWRSSGHSEAKLFKKDLWDKLAT